MLLEKCATLTQLARYFHFIERTNPDPLAYKKDPGTPNLPGFKVRQQTMDVTTLLTEGKLLV